MVRGMTREQVEARVATLRAEIREFELAGNFGLARLKKGDVEFYVRALEDKQLA